MSDVLDTWLYVTPANWAAIAPGAEDPVQPWHRVYHQATFIGSDYWKQWQGTHNVYNPGGLRSEIDALETALGAAVARRFDWHQGNGMDEKYTHPTIPADVLAVMKDHQEYDVDGNPLPPVAATYAKPNWGHVFLGQTERIFAGETTDEFSDEFL